MKNSDLAGRQTFISISTCSSVSGLLPVSITLISFLLFLDLSSYSFSIFLILFVFAVPISDSTNVYIFLFKTFFLFLLLFQFPFHFHFCFSPHLFHVWFSSNSFSCFSFYFYFHSCFLFPLKLFSLSFPLKFFQFPVLFPLRKFSLSVSVPIPIPTHIEVLTHENVPSQASISVTDSKIGFLGMTFQVFPVCQSSAFQK